MIIDTRALFSLSLSPLLRKLRRRSIAAELKRIRIQRAQIVQEREAGFSAERYLQGREAVLTSDLHNF
jgi:hypothetical protein